VLRGEENAYPALIDISSFLYDFNLLYEYSRLIADPKYGRYKFTRFSAYRNGKRVWPDDRLEVESLRLESPLLLLAIIAAVPAGAAALLALTQAVEKIANFSLNRELLKLQVEKLRKELDSAPASVPWEALESDSAFEEQLHIREADYYFDRVRRHQEESSIRIKELEITYVRELPPKQRT
jgi:hypothetical protein